MTAAEAALGWKAGAFLEAYTGNREAANDLALEAALIVPPLRDLLAAKGGAWQGTATELLHNLHDHADERTRESKGWPTNGRVMSNALRRIAPNLRVVGIGVTFHPRRSQGRRLTVNAPQLEYVGKFASPASPASPIQENQAFTGDANLYPRNPASYKAGDAGGRWGRKKTSLFFSPPNRGGGDMTPTDLLTTLSQLGVELALKAVELEDLEVRIAALEGRLTSSPPGSNGRAYQ